MQTLKERIEEVMAAKKWSIAAVARAAGVSHSAVSQWLGRGGAIIETINSTAAAKLEAASGYNAVWLATGKGPKEPQNVPRMALGGIFPSPAIIEMENNPDYPAVRRVSVKAQAGVTGYAVEDVTDCAPIVFRADWYRTKGYRPERLMALRVAGESMVPTLYPDDLIVVNTEMATPRDGVTFLVIYEGEAVVKRLVRDDGLWWLCSDNPDHRRYPRKKCNGDTQIIGEVVYRQTERI